MRLPGSALLRLAVVCSVLSCAPHAARAQDAGAAQPALPADVSVDPETGERFRWERPEEELRRGPLSAPAWLVMAGGVAVAAAAVVLLVTRARRRR